MASARSIKAGSAFVELFLRDNKLRQGLLSISTRMQSFGRGIAGVGGGVLALASAASAPLIAMTAEFTKAGDAIDKMSIRTGIAAGPLSQLGFAAEQSGSSLEVVENGVKRMQANILSLERGLSTSVDTFEDLGLSLNDLQGISPDEQFKRIADRIADVEDPSRRAALAMQVFGRAGQQLVPLLAAGADGITALQNEAADLGLTIDQEGAGAAAQMADAWNRVTRVFKAVRLTIGQAFASDLTKVANLVAQTSKHTVTWLQSNRQLLSTIGRVTVGVAAVGAGLVLVGGSIVALGAVVGSAATLMGAFGTAVSAIGAGLAFMVSPAGLAIGAIVGIGAAILKVTGAGAAGIEFLRGAFITLRDDALRAFGGISDALAAGNIGQAAEILWLTLKLEWQRGISYLNSQWQEWKSFFLSVINEATFSAAAFFTDAWAGIQTTWLETVDVLRNGWELFTSSVQRTWATAQNFISKGILQLMSLLDDTVDVAAASAVLDQDLNAANQRRDQQRDQAIYQRELQRQQRLDQIERDRLSARSVLEQQRLAEQSAIYDRQNQALEDSQRDLDEARAKWNAALEAAAGAREQAEAGGSGDSGVAAKVRDLLDTVSGAASVRLAAIGGPTFSGRAAEQIFGSGNATDLARRTLDVAKQQLDEQKKIRQATENNKPVWGP